MYSRGWAQVLRLGSKYTLTLWATSKILAPFLSYTFSAFWLTTRWMLFLCSKIPLRWYYFQMHRVMWPWAKITPFPQLFPGGIWSQRQFTWLVHSTVHSQQFFTHARELCDWHIFPNDYTLLIIVFSDSSKTWGSCGRGSDVEMRPATVDKWLHT